MDNEIFDRAIAFAVKAHSGKTRKGSGSPVIVHVLEAAVIAATMTNDPEVLAAAVLHDTVEDTDVTYEDILENFGKRVAELVASETEDKRRGTPPSQSWEVRKQEAINQVLNSDDRDVKILFLSDKLSNMRSFNLLSQQKGKKMWEIFNQKDPEMHHWYYRSVANALRELEDTAAWQEYDRLIRTVFES